MEALIRAAVGQSCGARAISAGSLSSSDHPSSIIPHQFAGEPICMIEAAGDYAGTYYRHFDAETGLYYYRARYYHPEIGRFFQTDPIGYGDGMNRYRYCRNNAWNLPDPWGTEAGAGFD